MKNPKTKINKFENDWIDIKNKCRTTVNKEHSDIEATSNFKRKLLTSEHSPIRLLKVNWLWEGIKSWVATHYVRHHIGIEKFVSTQRTDRTNVNRDELPQGALVNFEAEANAQSLIEMARKRLCYQASKETRDLMVELKKELYKTEPELAWHLVPNCVYRCGCPEFKECGYWTRFVAGWFDFKNAISIPQYSINYIADLSHIDTRYNMYDKDFKTKENIEQ